LLLLVAALHLGVALDGSLALRDKPGPVALMLLLGFVAVLPVRFHHVQTFPRVLQALFLLRRELAFLQRLKIAVLVEPVGLEFLLHLFPPPLEMRLALDELDGAAGQAGALQVELLQGLPFAVVYGLDVMPVPVDALAVAGFQG
jgi:hypothetical protein